MGAHQCTGSPGQCTAAGRLLMYVHELHSQQLDPDVARSLFKYGNIVNALNADNKNDLGEDCIPAYCQPSVTVHGDGVWLPRAPFAGTQWVTAIHSELFSEYTGWSFSFLELAATAGALKGFTEVMGFFHWKANNTGSYHGLSPTYRQSADFGVLHATTDKSGKVTDVTIWRAGFMEEREVLLLQPQYDDIISAIGAIVEQPFWIPSQSLQLKMITHAHTLIEVLNQGDKFLDSLDDIAVENVVLIDGMYIWGPAKQQGLTALKMWVSGWLQQYDVNAAILAATATPTSNKVFLCFKMLLTSGGSSAQVDGCLMYVFNIQGFITHILVYRNGTPKERAEKFIGGSSRASPIWQWLPPGQQQHVPTAAVAIKAIQRMRFEIAY